MAKVPVFAGLGSDLVFDAARQITSIARSPHGHILLESCYTIFLEELSLAAKLRPLGLDVADFNEPQSLLTPTERYQSHPIIQHATLALVQLLQYQSQNFSSRHYDVYENKAVAGFCGGMLAAVAVATSITNLDFLQRAAKCFRLAILLGISSEWLRRELQPIRSDLAWSAVVANLSHDELSELISAYNLEAAQSTSQPACAAIYISATNARKCHTVSGIGESLAQFLRTKLPSQSRVKPLDLFSLYHNEPLLRNHLHRILSEYDERKLSFPSYDEIVVPIISNVDGELITPRSNSGSTLLTDVLDMILSKATDWMAVEDRIVKVSTSALDERQNILSVCNYGPGYGALSGRQDIPSIRVCDTSSSKECQTSDDEIAIIGVGLDLPGASDLDQLWSNLEQGLNSCSEIPSDRFHVNDYYADGKPLNSKRSMRTKYGNFLDDAFLFDNQLFAISPREAPSIDPQQRILLQTVYRALEDAGYTPNSTPCFSRKTFGCFMGNATLDYLDNLKNAIDVYYSPGTLRAFISGRISYAFKWSGPSMTIDTACSSSLASVHQAVQALRSGDCKAAVAGGVNIISSPDMYCGLDRAHFLSPTGQCKPFDASADGYCRSEGSTVFVLKKLSDALKENDNILGVIKAIAVNQSGNSSSITHPHAPTQEDLFRKLLAETKLHPHDVNVVEAHGTGTQAGDPTELRGIRNVFCQGRTKENPLHISSIKGNIGHCEAASGGASLAKLLVMLKHKRVPPQAFLRNLNPAIGDLEADRVIISDQAHEWEAPAGRPRVALLNNFGAAGSNVGLMLEEYVGPLTSAKKEPLELCLPFGISARSPEMLEQARANLLEYLSLNDDVVALSDICYTSMSRRTLHQYRLTATASSIPELITSLKRAPVVESPKVAPPTVLLFSGQGSQYVGMGRDLMNLLPEFHSVVMHCHDLLTEWGLPSCLEVIQPSAEHSRPLNDPITVQAFQSGIFALEVALARTLVKLGIKPAAVAGHSLGEYAALVIAGVLTLESGLWLVAQRAALIVRQCELWQSSMLAINMGASDVRPILSRKEYECLSIACENAPSSCVVGGPNESLRTLRDYIADQLDKQCTLLAVPIAYHTAQLEPIRDDLRKLASRVQWSAPSVPIASNVLGRMVQPGENIFGAEYVVEHCLNPVCFDSAIADILDHELALDSGKWIEIGPHPSLLPMIRSRNSTKALELLPTIRKDRHVSQTLSELFTALYKDDQGSMVWRQVFEGMSTKPRVIALPPAPMNRTRYLVPLPRERSEDSKSPSEVGVPTPFTVLASRVETAGETVIFETPIQQLAKLIKGHKVCSEALCPASVYAEIALAAVTIIGGTEIAKQDLRLEESVFSRPLLYSPESTLTVRVKLTPVGSTADKWAYEVTSRSETAEERVHCTGIVASRPQQSSHSKVQILQQTLDRRRKVFENGDYQSFTRKTMYDRIFSRVVEYDSTYHSVRKLSMDDDSKEIFALCDLPERFSAAKYAADPILLDTMLHVAGFGANLAVDNLDVCICHKVDSTKLYRKEFKPQHRFEVHCSNFSLSPQPGTIIADAHAMDEAGVIAVMKGIHFQTHKLAKIKASFEWASKEQGRTNSVARIPVSHPGPETPARTSKLHSGTQTPDTEITLVSSRGVSSERQAIRHDSVICVSVVCTVLAETTGVKVESLTPRTELAALGVDSLMIFEVQQKLEQALGNKIKNSALLSCQTVEDMEMLCNSQQPLAIAASRCKSITNGTIEPSTRSLVISEH